jgi:hypothetical protein
MKNAFMPAYRRFRSWLSLVGEVHSAIFLLLTTLLLNDKKEAFRKFLFCQRTKSAIR